ncbi:peptidase family C50-domain-containing protein [Leucosporidium creatinivorum]|uniref:separase n=1 Tax=Leucosporidium creatinivorum TaxID=106004 RepID=A0A1Y2G3B5_9BASI|nr:peptidase family C50-domain-containing protein [Leucosporidium creatinivorum]
MASRPPPAPARPRRALTTRSTPAPAPPNKSNEVDQLADDLGASLAISKRPPTANKSLTASKRAPPPAKPPPKAAATARPAPTSKAAAVSKPTSSLAKSTASSVPPAERAKSAMKSINTSLQALFALKKSGWRASASAAPTPSSSRAPSTSTVQARASSSSLASNAAGQAGKDKAEAETKTCAAGLKELRELIRDRLINYKATDVERAAGSLIGHLLDMELYRLALVQLSLMRASILTWYSPSSSLTAPQAAPLRPGSKPPSLTTFVPIFSLPIPSPSFFAPPTLDEAVGIGASRPTAEELVPLVILLQQYTAGCLFRAEMTPEEQGKRAEGLAEAWREGGSPVEWKAVLERALGSSLMKEEEKEAMSKRVDAMMSSVFGCLTKGCIGADTLASPSTVLHLRSRALLCYATTSTLYSAQEKLDAFYDQTRKVLLLYGRQAEQQKVGETLINEGVKGVFEEVLAVLQAKEAKREGQAWTTLCEVVMHIAKRADDLPMVERVSNLLGGSSTSSSPADNKPVDLEAQCAQVCAKVLNSLSVIEHYFKTGEDKSYLDHSRRIITSLPILSRLRTNSSVSPASHSKIDKMLERLRYVVMKRHKGEKRVDQLTTSAGEKRKEKGEKEGEEQKMCEALLEGVVAHVESLSRTFGKENFHGRGNIYDTCVEVLLQLTYSALIIDDRSSHAPTFNTLERCLPFIAATSSSPSSILDLTAHFSIRAIASASYNIAAQLFNAGKPEMAVKFAKRAAETTQSAVDELKLVMDGEEGIETGLAKLSLVYGEEKAQKEAEEKRLQKVKERNEAIKEAGEKYLSKRWELMALCQQAIGDKKLAYAAYLIQRATRLSTFELLLPGSEVCLQKPLEEAGVGAMARALCVEMQIACLETVLDKREAQEVLPSLIEALLELYEEERHPIRRARTLVRRMQQQCMPNSIAQDLSAAAVAAEIDSLCSQESLGEDAALRPFASQYLAFSHLWLAFHAHQAQLPAFSESTSTEARSALRILRKGLEGDIPPSPSAPKKATPPRPVAKAKSPKAPGTTTRRRAAAASKAPTAAEKRALAFKTPVPSRTLPGTRRVALEHVTPPSRNLVDAEEKPATPKKGETAVLLLDDPERCYNALETMANLLGALGYSLLKIAYLKFLRRLSSKVGDKSSAYFVTSSAHLGHEYVLLGKTSRAGLVFAQADSRIQGAAKAGSPVPPAAQLVYLTLHAEYLAVLGNIDRSAQTYTSAQTLAETLIPDDSSPSVTTRVVERTLHLQRCALAAGVSSVLFQRRGDLNRSLASALQAMRVWCRASANLARLSTTESKASTPTNEAATFTSVATDPNAPLPEHPPASTRKRTAVSTGPHASLSWELAEAFGGAILRVATLYSTRGTPKAAEHYADGAMDFAKEMGSTRFMARALAVRTEVRLHAGNLEGAEMDLELIGGALGSTSCPEAVDAQRLQADLHLRQDLAAEAHRGYLDAQRSLDSFVSDAADFEAGQTPAKPTPSKHLSPVQHRSATKGSPMAASPSPSAPRSFIAADWILPTVQGYLLRMRVNLLRLENKQEESLALLHRLSKLSTREEDVADESKLLATIQFQDLLKRFSSDPVLGMLPDSVLSMPTLGAPAVAAVKIASPKSAPSLLHCLREVETLLSRAVALSVSRTEPAKLRELSLLTATLRALQVSIGKPSKRSAASVAHVLDLGLAVTLRREMLEAIDYKIADSARVDDLHWPVLESAPTSDESNQSSTLKYWTGLRERYRSEAPELTLTDAAFSTVLPDNWTTVSIHLSPSAIAFSSEGEDESFTYDIALEELTDIITANNLAAQNAKHIKSKEERLAWWTERKGLDERLKVLTQTIEDDWLGAFKSIFCDARSASSEAFATFKSRIERILKRSIVRASQDKKASRFKLDDTILECLAALPPASREEDLEDLFHFMMESFQFTGVPVASDETDVDQVVVDIRSALEELHGHSPSRLPDPEQHTFLILDKAVQSFPWESIPCLRKRSISRIPSLAFLRDRIDLAATRNGDDEHPHEITVDATRTSFLLNPGGDLGSTQTAFEPLLEKMRADAGWSGIVGRVPSDEEVKVALSNNDLFLYFGHGGAEQYVRSQTIRHLPRCATTMLWGCSSGLLKDQGDFDPVGTPYHYMIAGCPALVANLWDVTDKDIDKFAQQTFALLHLGMDSPSPSLASSASSSKSTSLNSRGLTISAAIAQSRDAPLLKYLNGAAPVVYGVPVRFTSPMCPREQ